MDPLAQALVQMVVAIIGSGVAIICAALYFRHIRLERPPIGRFNSVDVGILMFFIVALPFGYVIMPSWLLLCFLVLTFASALYMTLRPLLRPRFIWP